MRKIMAIVVGLVMLFGVPALGEEIDFSSMSFGELTKLCMQFVREFHNKAEEYYGGSMIYEGDYVAGIDIKPGRYQFLCVGVDSTSSSSFLNIYRPNDDKPNHWITDSTAYTSITNEMPVYFTLGENWRVGVYACYGILIPVELQDKPVWAP